MPRATDPAWRRWEEVDRIFAAALERAPASRMRFVETACGADQELLDTVRSLLKESAESEGKLVAPGAALVRALWADARGERVTGHARSTGPGSRRVPGRFRPRRWLAAAAALATLLLGGYGTALTLHARGLERERNQALAQAERAHELRDFLVDVLGAADPHAPADSIGGSSFGVAEALGVGAARARTELVDRPLLQADVLSAMARIYLELELEAPARLLLAEALAVRAGSGADRSPEQAADLGRLAYGLGSAGDADSAESLHRRRIALERELGGEASPGLAEALTGFARHARAQGRLDEALYSALEAVRIRRSQGPEQREALAGALSILADAYQETGRLREAEATAREALALHREVLGEEHPRTAELMVHLARTLHERGRVHSARALYRRALPVLDRTLGPEHATTLDARYDFAVVLSDGDDHAGAEVVHRQLLAVRRVQSGGQPTVAVAGSLQNLAANLLRQGRYAEADSMTAEAAEVYRTALPAGHYLTAFPLLTRAEIQLARGDAAAAEESAAEAWGILRTALPAGHFVTSVAECRLGSAQWAQGRTDEAGEHLEAAWDVLRATDATPRRYLQECAARVAVGSGGGSRTASRARGEGSELATPTAFRRPSGQPGLFPERHATLA